MRRNLLLDRWDDSRHQCQCVDIVRGFVGRTVVRGLSGLRTVCWTFRSFISVHTALLWPISGQTVNTINYTVKIFQYLHSKNISILAHTQVSGLIWEQHGSLEIKNNSRTFLGGLAEFVTIKPHGTQPIDERRANYTLHSINEAGDLTFIQLS